jgi:segregation and condensation protein A
MEESTEYLNEALAGGGEGALARFVVDIDGFEGPIDVLLSLAREQKVDLAHLSILQLAEQYLQFVTEARRTNLELAADYLVMAAWLAYLKSRLILPDSGEEDEPTGEEMAAALAFQLRRLQAMRDAGAKIMARPRLDRDFYRRGDPEKFTAVYKSVLDVTLYDLLKGYGEQRRRSVDITLHIEPWELYTVEDALKRLQGLLGSMPDWQNMAKFLPPDMVDELARRSALASFFAASLEMTRQGRMRISQAGPFEPIYLRSARGNMPSQD